MGSRESPLIFFNVLAWNGERWLKPCLDSLLDSARSSSVPVKIHVVDNASSDGTSGILECYAGRVSSERLPRNLGFPGGHNHGIRRALSEGARWIGLLNQDLRVHPGWIEPLLRIAEREERAGILSPFQYDYEGETLEPGFRRALTFLPEAAAGLSTGQWDRPFYRSDMAVGAAILVHRRVFERVGLFDPAYFAYHEEVDLYNRAMAAGAEILLVPGSRVYHWHNLRRGRMSRRLSWINMRNSYRVPLKDPRAFFLRNIFSALRAWGEHLSEALRDKAALRFIALLLIGLFDVPPRLPFIFFRRARDKRFLAVAPRPFSNRDGA